MSFISIISTKNYILIITRIYKQAKNKASNNEYAQFLCKSLRRPHKFLRLIHQLYTAMSILKSLISYEPARCARQLSKQLLKPARTIRRLIIPNDADKQYRRAD